MAAPRSNPMRLCCHPCAAFGDLALDLHWRGHPRWRDCKESPLQLTPEDKKMFAGTSKQRRPVFQAM